MKKCVDNEQSYQWLKFEDIKGEQKVKLWQFRIRQSAQTTYKKNSERIN
jgi:hypothetical protein